LPIFAVTQRAGALSVFYPSSIFVEERPVGMTEYGMAKIAGETLCADLMRDTPGLTILVSRLPRVLTDQTTTVALIDAADPCQVLLPLVRQVQACNPTDSGDAG
jgi:hypothetical protein